MKICDDAWENFALYASVVYNGDPHLTGADRLEGGVGNTIFGNKNADLFDVFNFWREDIQGGHPYSKKYLEEMKQEVLKEENDARSKATVGRGNNCSTECGCGE